MKFRLNNEEATFNICWPMKQRGELQTVSAISLKVESISEVQIEKRLGVQALMVVIMNFESDGIDEYGSLVAALVQIKYRPKVKKFL